MFMKNRCVTLQNNCVQEREREHTEVVEPSLGGVVGPLQPWRQPWHE